MFFFFQAKNIIISLFNPVFVRSLDFNSFFIIEWSAGPVISAFGVNIVSGCSDLKFTKWADSWFGWDLISQLGKSNVKWSSELYGRHIHIWLLRPGWPRVKQPGDTFIYIYTYILLSDEDVQWWTHFNTFLMIKFCWIFLVKLQWEFRNKFMRRTFKENIDFHWLMREREPRCFFSLCYGLQLK